MSMAKFRPWDQIMYIPDHAEGDASHPDVEYGFVTSVHPVKEDQVFCRYWREKDGQMVDLRTKSCSMLTPANNLRKHVSVNKSRVEAVAFKYGIFAME